MGLRATERLRDLVAVGGLDLTEVQCSCRERTIGTRFCNAGRKCGALAAHGRLISETMTSEGLARPFICGENQCPRPRPQPH